MNDGILDYLITLGNKEILDYLINLGLILLFSIAFILNITRKKLLAKKKAELKSFYKDKVFFLCEGIYYLKDNFIQFSGETFGSSIRPSMKLYNPSIGEYVIKEVYADEENPDKSSPEIPDGTTDAAIVIQTDNFNRQAFEEILAKDKIVVFEVR